MYFANTEVFNFEGALRGMRNPFESWSRSDSGYIFDVEKKDNKYKYQIGPNDLEVAQRLVKAGPEHRKFMRQIFVSVDITAPLYWWKEFDTYKVGTTANSTSTMHKLASTPITKDCFESFKEELLNIGDYIEINDEVIGEHINRFIKILEELRIEYNKTKNKNIWKLLIKLLPSSWLQTRTVTMTYENILNMSHQRRGHKLTEWSDNFKEWVASLPYAEELLLLNKK